MRKIIDKLIQSFEYNDAGFSSKKITAFIIVILVIIGHIKYFWSGDLNMIENIFFLDYGFICVLFGLTTYHTLKTNNKNE